MHELMIETVMYNTHGEFRTTSFDYKRFDTEEAARAGESNYLRSFRESYVASDFEGERITHCSGRTILTKVSMVTE
jgi:hypothetical protein